MESKKLRHIFRLVRYMIRNGIISRRKLILDLHLLIKRSKFIGKAIANIFTFNNNHENLHEIQFSYSNKRKNRNRHQDTYDYKTVEDVTRVFEISDVESIMNSPMWGDSPFAIREEEVVDGRVDEEAEEFIKRFYEKLRIQQRIAMSPKAL